MNANVEDEEMKYDQEIEELLPWYAKDLLEPEQKARVDAYLADHPDMRIQLDLIAQEDEASQQIHASLGAPRPGGLDALMAKIDAEGAPATQAGAHSSKSSSLWAYVQNFLRSFQTPGMQMAAMAAALVIVAQAVIIGGLVDPSSQNGQGGVGQSFKVASGKDPAVVSSGVRLLLSFHADTKIAEITALLSKSKAKIVGGPKAGGFYEIAVSDKDLPEGGVKALKASFASNSTVRFVSVQK